MKKLLNILEQVPEFGQLLANLENGRSPVAVSVCLPCTALILPPAWV